MVKGMLEILVTKIKNLGFFSVIKYLVKRAYFTLLQRKYRFDVWHAATPYEARAYKKTVVELASKLGVDSVVEIGCGLGEILARIDSKNKFGVDRELAVIDAANHLYKKQCQFYGIDLDDFVAEFPHEKFELLIMVNWVHEIPWLDLKQKINDIHAKFHNKFLLIDAVSNTVEGFQHYHNEEQIRSLGDIVDVRKNLDEARSVYLINLD